MHSLPVMMAMALLLLLGACRASDEPGTPPGRSADASPTTAPAAGFDQDLHDELVAMLGADQEERLGGGPLRDEERTERLKDIVAEHGWPTISLVGEDGEDAAWAIAQHADHDPAFQEQAIALISEAVERGEASPGNLAYLIDRVAVGKGEPQPYGTQVGCGPDGPEPATPLVDETAVNTARAEAGLAPWEDYLAEMTEICSQGGP